MSKPNRSFIYFYINSLTRLIIQYDRDDNVIKKWNSIREASKQLDIHRMSLYFGLTGKAEIVGGYKWKYVE